MASGPTNKAIPIPTEYSDGWSHNELITQYLDLYAKYLTLRKHINRARIALPFARERTIHNQQNRRLHLEDETRQLHHRNVQLENANLKNHAINHGLRKDYANIEETLRTVMDAQPGASKEDTQELKSERTMLPSESEELRTRIHTEAQWQREEQIAKEILSLKDELVGLQTETDTTSGEIERLNERLDESEYTNALLVKENEELQEEIKRGRNSTANRGSNEDECAKKCKGLQENVELLFKVIANLRPRLTEDERLVVDTVSDTKPTAL